MLGVFPWLSLLRFAAHWSMLLLTAAHCCTPLLTVGWAYGCWHVPHVPQTPAAPY